MFGWIQRLAWRARRSKALSWTALGQVVLLNALFLFSSPLLFADDCTRDWRRAED